MVQTSWLECILVTFLSYSDDVCYQSTDNNCFQTFQCFQTRSWQCFCIAYVAKIELKSDKKYQSNADKFISNQFAKFGLVLSKNKNRPKIVTELLKTCWFQLYRNFWFISEAQVSHTNDVLADCMLVPWNLAPLRNGVNYVMRTVKSVTELWGTSLCFPQ